MKEFKTFYFEKFSFDSTSLKAKFFYSFDKKQNFIEEIDFSSDFKVRQNLDKNIIDNILFSIHLALGISYYKLFPTKSLIAESGVLTDNQIKFWEKFYKN
jgi:ribosomal protein L11 methylase PrmA